MGSCCFSLFANNGAKVIRDKIILIIVCGFMVQCLRFRTTNQNQGNSLAITMLGASSFLGTTWTRSKQWHLIVPKCYNSYKICYLFTCYKMHHLIHLKSQVDGGERCCYNPISRDTLLATLGSIVLTLIWEIKWQGPSIKLGKHVMQ